jgi:hypothetical protein
VTLLFVISALIVCSTLLLYLFCRQIVVRALDLVSDLFTNNGRSGAFRYSRFQPLLASRDRLGASAAVLVLAGARNAFSTHRRGNRYLGADCHGVGLPDLRP